MGTLAEIQGDLSVSLQTAGIQSILPESVSMDSFVRCAAVAIAGNKDLMTADKDSMIMALTKCASDGLVPDNKEAAITVFSTNVAPKGQPKQWIKKAQYMPMIDGVMKRARMSGQITILSSKAVYNDDAFDYWLDENGEHINYRPLFKGGEVRLAFAFAKLQSGELIVEVMTKQDIDKVKNSSKTSGYGPWVDWYDRMACKAVMHRLARRLPNASEVVAMCEAGTNMKFSKEKEVIEMEPMLVQDSSNAKESPLLIEQKETPTADDLNWIAAIKNGKAKLGDINNEIRRKYIQSFLN